MGRLLTIIFFLALNLPVLSTDSLVIPDHFSNQLTLRQPTQNWLSTDSELLIQGKNSFLGAVFINGKKVKLSRDGRFNYELSLEDVGRNQVYVTFVLPDFRFFTLQRRGLYFATPLGIENLDYNTESLTKVFNSGFLSDSLMQYSLQTIFTLDMFVNLLDGLRDFRKDLLMGSWSVSDDLVEKDFASFSKPIVYIDDHHPKDLPVSRFIFWSELADLLRLSPTDSIVESPFIDLNYNWQKSILQPLVDNKILDKSPYFYPDSHLTFETVLSSLCNVPWIQDKITSFSDFSIGFVTNNVVFENHLRVVNDYVNQQRFDWTSRQKLTLSSPTSDVVTLVDVAVFNGQVFPPKPFRINNFVIVPELTGVFYQELPLFSGENVFEIASGSTTLSRRFFLLNKYPDLDAHWFSIKAAKLRYLNLLPPGDLFLPHSKISRLDLAELLNRFFKLSNPHSEIVVNDVPSNNDVYRVVFNKVMSLDQNNNFNPSVHVTRMQALTAIIEASRLGGKLFQEPILFKDVAYDHWGYRYLEIAVHNDIIQRAENFYPSRYINKAELYAILSRLPFVQSMFKETWP